MFVLLLLLGVFKSVKFVFGLCLNAENDSSLLCVCMLIPGRFMRNHAKVLMSWG